MSDVPPTPDRRLRPDAMATAVAAVVTAGLVGGAAAGGRTVLTVVLLLIGLIVSTTLPRLAGVPQPKGTSVVLAGSAVLVFVMCLLIDRAGGLRWLPVDALKLRQLATSDWSGFSRTVEGDPAVPTAVDLLSAIVRPVLSAG